MLWERWEGQWHGVWRWGEWETRETQLTRADDYRARPIPPWLAANIPQEILLRIIACVIGGALTATGEIEEAMKIRSWSIPVPRVQGLHNLRCRPYEKTVVLVYGLQQLGSRLVVVPAINDGGVSRVMPMMAGSDVQRRLGSR